MSKNEEALAQLIRIQIDATETQIRLLKKLSEQNDIIIKNQKAFADMISAASGASEGDLWATMQKALGMTNG